MSYEFQSILYRTPVEMCRGIAMQWLCADGLNGRGEVEQMLAGAADDDLAVAVIAAWNLDVPGEFDERTWMARRGIDNGDIAAGFRWVRDNIDIALAAEIA